MDAEGATGKPERWKYVVRDKSGKWEEYAQNKAISYLDPPDPKKLEDPMDDLVDTAQNVLEASGSDFLFVCVINPAYLKMTLGWLCNTQGMRKVHESTMVICTEWKVCRDLQKRFPKVNYYVSKTKVPDDELKWGSEHARDLLLKRAQILAALVYGDLNIVLFETDAVWFRNPMKFFTKKFRKAKADIIVPRKGLPAHGLTYTFNPMLVRPSNTTKHFLAHLYDTLKWELTADQDVLDAMCVQQYFDAKCRKFKWEDLADGLWFQREEHNRPRINPYVVNNNYNSGIEHKISQMALNGLWFIDVNAYIRGEKKICDFKRIRSKIELDDKKFDENEKNENAERRRIPNNEENAATLSNQLDMEQIAREVEQIAQDEKQNAQGEKQIAQDDEGFGEIDHRQGNIKEAESMGVLTERERTKLPKIPDEKKGRRTRK